MPKIRIQAREMVRYEKEIEVSQDTLDMMVGCAADNDRPDPSDFLLNPEDIVDGEIDRDDICIDVFDGDKWLPAFP